MNENQPGVSAEGAGTPNQNAAGEWTHKDNERLLECRDFVLVGLRVAMERRPLSRHWVEKERVAVAVAANQWAEANGSPVRTTVADVERIEGLAVGHVDYARKLALYVAERVCAVGSGVSR